jgi:nitric oxide reductase subunit B
MVTENENKIGKSFLAVALVMLLVGSVFGVIASINYVAPGYSKAWLGFIQLRPLHVSSIMFFLLIGASGCVYSCIHFIAPNKISSPIAYVQLALWICAIFVVFFSYVNMQFGGREYWEFPPQYAIIIVIAWLLFIVNFLKAVLNIKHWRVYMWMWMTGIFFFLLTFTENYLWEFPYFREHFVKDMTIQWKANGALVGAWNQMIYGTAFFLMEKISKGNKYAGSHLAFRMYFLGLFNLMFNWGHHIYTLPTDSYVRYVSYIVSMTEWIILARIIYLFRKTITDAQKFFHYFPFRFLIASEVWVFFNLALAILMSIPVLNLYTHGTHITVAHAIVLGACFEFLKTDDNKEGNYSKLSNFFFWMLQISNLIFWVTLIIIGLTKGSWQMSNQTYTFTTMMSNMHGWFMLFVISGSLLMISIVALAIDLLNAYFRRNVFNKKTISR